MQPLPSTDLRSNLGTWAVPAGLLPALGHFLHDVLPNESYDPAFKGQYLETTYFDTSGFALRKARLKGSRYLTLRIRCYSPPYAAGNTRQEEVEVYALSAKTESAKYRVEIEPTLAELILSGGLPYADAYAVLPGDLQARLRDLTQEKAVVPVVTVCGRRYAVEDAADRYTLDVDIRTDSGRRLPVGVLEFKSTDRNARPPGRLQTLGLRPIKLSKFLWSTEV